MLDRLGQLKTRCSGLLVTELGCCSCKGKSQSVENFSCLSLNIPAGAETSEPASLVDCIEETFKKEETDDTWYCTYCGNRTGQKHSWIYSSPIILVLHLKRFQLSRNGYHKDKVAVKLPELFAIGQDRYRIIGKVNHIGRRMTSGHYTAEINAGEWKRCDDTTIVQIGRMDVNSREAYIVFCEKIDGTVIPAGNA